MECIHHWYLNSKAVDGIIHAKCLKCGAERDYPSVIHFEEYADISEKLEVSYA